MDHGGDVNLPSRGGVCSLHLAARCGHSHVVELLLDKGDFHMHLSSFGVPKEMSKAMVAILVLDQLTSQSPDWPWHYSILSYTGQEMPKTQLCCSFVIEAAPPKTK